MTRTLHLSLAIEGSIPARGLIVSNHLGYLDILTFAAAAPCIFLSKQEVCDWPVFGTLARFGGTVFVDRERRTGVRDATLQISAALHAGLRVVVFPEGTSTNGSEILPFRASLLQAAIHCEAPITAAAVGYKSPFRSESDFCYYGNIHFVPHLLSMLRLPNGKVRLSFSLRSSRYTDRKTAARTLHQQTANLRAAMHAHGTLSA
jgi:1-acyl-sn-glycerol-3-phosphate acyltransferase